MEQSAPFTGWAIVEQMGHKTIVGHVSEQLVAGVPLLRIDVPGPDGSPDPRATQFIHASTLYALTPTTEAIARKAAARTYTAPAAYLPAGRDVEDLDDFDDPEDEAQDPEDAMRELLQEAGLSKVLAILITQFQDVAEPESDRYTAILEHAKDLVEHDGAWPERLAPAVTEPPTLVPGDELPPPAPGAPVADDGIPF